ncbi:lipocalin family protein [Flavihumibacter petaseus]|uniref:Lipocalin-like domain-containing protein n=1 Tax=Flavihumibacter petaseus NBRC 106054 TaxID=1220578 RepID=A0A0E9MVT2_9BACT|nr:lipocalin family protein [Flavihumibacter petaseus]GAO41521.1 hypothetical protein FPE01S_01_05350 [Flavihumibacter petaseus NBRC 106054]
MKRLSGIFIIAGLLLILGSCHKSDDSTVSEQTSILTSGNWKIVHFEEDGVDETTDFSGYTFMFHDDGTAMATRNSNTTNGSFTFQHDDDRDKLLLFLGSADPLEELNEDWQILELNENRIRLEHTSGGDGSQDFVTFEKI